MIKIGMCISGRYEIIEKVGAGGMADVYKARDNRLNRYVAIKVLKQEYSADTKFVTKFRAEAQSVAGLAHPNIVMRYMMSVRKTDFIISLWNLLKESHLKNT